MKAGFVAHICLTSLLLLAGCQASSIDPSATGDLSMPPKPKIVWNENRAATVPTSFCWSYDDQATCTDMAAPPEIVGEHKPAPLQVQPGAIVTISYEQPPVEKSLVLTQWVGSNQIEHELQQDNKWQAPEEPGWYLFDVRAEWQQGSAGHAFVIEVRSNSRSEYL